MPTYDAYVKFGDDPEIDGLEPLIPGDSDDHNHVWWCELRDGGFSLDVKERGPQQDSESNDENKEPNATFQRVTLKKRIDWASTDLIKLCCKAGSPKIAKKTDDEELEIEKVTVDVCRPIRAENLPFVKLIYQGVRIVSYKIELSEPEPSETIEIEFKKLSFEFVQTDPRTGDKIGGEFKTTDLENHNDALGKMGRASGGVHASSTRHGRPNGNGDSDSQNQPTPSSASQTPAAQNFPGLRQDNPLGILPH